MFTQEDFIAIVNNCSTLTEVSKYVRMIKQLNVWYGQPLYNIQELSLTRLNQIIETNNN